MAYCDFTLAKVREAFNLIIEEDRDLFAEVPQAQPSELLSMILKEYLNLAIAINSEKSRSEFIIAPILGEIRRLSGYQVSLFSGKEFNVDSSKGLAGYCDFILSYSKEQLYISAPVTTIVEANNENIIGGLGQCIAEMVAAQIFNQQSGNNIETIYGVVTSGTNWRFLTLRDHIVYIDTIEYYIKEIDKILGILLQFVSPINRQYPSSQQFL
jgi:hypothetical protein